MTYRFKRDCQYCSRPGIGADYVIFLTSRDESLGTVYEVEHLFGCSKCVEDNKRVWGSLDVRPLNDATIAVLIAKALTATQTSTRDA